MILDANSCGNILINNKVFALDGSSEFAVLATKKLGKKQVKDFLSGDNKTCAPLHPSPLKLRLTVVAKIRMLLFATTVRLK